MFAGRHAPGTARLGRTVGAAQSTTGEKRLHRPRQLAFYLDVQRMTMHVAVRQLADCAPVLELRSPPVHSP